MRILSWGCGVQSTALAVMSAMGYLPKLDAVITADLNWERAITYETRDFYKRFLEGRGIPIYIVDSGDIRQLGAHEHIHMPFWTSNGGPLQRQCTANFKIYPIRRLARQLLGFDPSKPPHPKPGTIEQWLGISLDEWTRMSQSDVKFTINRYPLVEKRITRNDCEDYLHDLGLPIPAKSACIGCPYRKASEYMAMPQSELNQAIDFDEVNRHNPLAERGNSTADALFIYRGVTPLPLHKADLERDAIRERQGKQLPLMICESGYCMV